MTLINLNLLVTPVTSILVFEEKTGRKLFVEASLVIYKKAVLMLFGIQKSPYPLMSQWIAECEQAGEFRMNQKADKNAYKIGVWISSDVRRSEAQEVQKVNVRLFLGAEPINAPQWQDVIAQIGLICRQFFPAMNRDGSYFHTHAGQTVYDCEQILFPQTRPVEQGQ